MVFRYVLSAALVLTASACALLRSAGEDGRYVSGRNEPPARLITEIPFVQFTGGVIILKGLIDDGGDTLRFILDTGSGGISLDSATCIRLGLKRIPSDRFIRGIGGITRLFYTGYNTLRLPGLTIDSLDFHIGNYDFISSVYGVRIDGIIGYSFLKRYIVAVNYDSLKLYVYSPGRFTYPRGGEMLDPVISNIPVVPAPLWNKKEVHTRYYFDMGAGLCLMLSNRFAEDSCLFCRPDQRRHRFVESEAQGLTGKIDMKQTVVQGIRIGKYYFRRVPTYLFDDVSNVTAYPSLGGLIGNDLLRRFNVILNYPAGRIWLQPNRHFHDPFDYSYTGMAMYFLSGHVVITDVMKNSPAERAGLQDGDVILAVNGDFSNDIQRYRELLKAAGTRVQLIILRDGELQKARLFVKSIL
jgi:hypothetical protein